MHRAQSRVPQPLDLFLLAVLLSLALATTAAAGPGVDPKEVPFDDPAWTIEAESHELTEFAGQKALRIHNGRALLSDVEITDGSIEFDIAFAPDRGFSGAMFRVVDPANYEDFYLRPHQSGQADASQYTPVVQSVSGWQLYHSPAYAAPFRHRYNEWMHVTITFAGSRATVDVDGETLFVPRLKRPVQVGSEGGSLGVHASFAPAYFANFRYTEGAPEDAFTDVADADPHLPELPDGLVRNWRVSEAFPTARRPSVTLDDTFHTDLEWRETGVEPEGFVNLAWSKGVSGENRAVLAEFTIDAQETGHRLVQFGYSDLVRVFVNGVEIYRGSNMYQSRDYRYLGTIGLFDAIVIPVRAGKNAVTFVVAENFGGWGVMAAVDPLP